MRSFWLHQKFEEILQGLNRISLVKSPDERSEESAMGSRETKFSEEVLKPAVNPVVAVVFS